MGEYATFKGQQIKLGTCEDMYYLRADQAHLVQAERGNVNPMASKDRASIRFRFPWPDEDHIEPGAFDQYDRAVAVHGVELPADLEHYTVQFKAERGYLMSVACPEAPDTERALGLVGLKIARNGFAGRVRIVQQAYRRGTLALVCQCGGCGARYNLPWDQAEAVVVACRAEGDRDAKRGGRPAWWHAIADRITAGYLERVGP